MYTRRHRIMAQGMVLSLLTICFLCPSIGRSNVLDSAKMMPSDTMIMVSVESIDVLREALKKTSWYDLYQDPAMQDVVRQAEEKIRDGAGDILKDFWKELEIDNPPEQLPWPEGKIVFGISLFPPKAETSSGTFNTEPLIFMALLADMGSHTTQTKEMLRALSTSAKDQGDTVERKRIAGIEMDVMPLEDQDDPIMSYGIKDNWLLITAADKAISQDATESVAKRIGRDLRGSLAENKGMVPARRLLGDGEIFMYVNADAIRTLVQGVAENKSRAEQITRALGLDNVTSIATSIHIAGDRSQDLCTKNLIGVDGPKKGLPALICPPSASLKLNDCLLTRDLIGFFWANYEPAQLFDGISKILGEVVYMDLNMLVQAGMMPTAQDGGQQPVQLRDEVIAQAQAPLFFTSKIEKPYSLSSPNKFLVGLSVRDENRLNAALARIHQAFIGRDSELRRELFDHTIYLFPEEAALESADPTTSEELPPIEQLAFSVTGDNLIFGLINEVEQAIRNLEAESTNTLASDPLFRHARKYLPSQAGLYSYRNDRLYAEIGWSILKQMVAELPDHKEDTPQYQLDLPDRIKTMLKKVNEHVDLSKLPEFDAIDQYWGTSISYGQNRPEGIYIESIMLKPARQ